MGEDVRGTVFLLLFFSRKLRRGMTEHARVSKCIYLHVSLPGGGGHVQPYNNAYQATWE